MWLAIAMTVLAATGNSVGKVLQKQAAGRLPRLVLRREVVGQFLGSRLYMLGMACDLVGALLMVAAFAHAPVSVVQPVSAVGLVILLVFSHFYLAERLRPAEWLAAAIAGLGVLGLGATAEPHHTTHSDKLHPFRIMGGFLAMVATLAVECWLRHRRGGHTGPTTKSAFSSVNHLGGGHLAAATAGASGGSSTNLAGGVGGGGGIPLGGDLDGGGSVYRGLHKSHAAYQQGGGVPLVSTVVQQPGGQAHHSNVPINPTPTHYNSSRGAGSSNSSSSLASVAASRGGYAANDAVLCGLESGACFGLSAACCRTGFILARRVSWAWALAGLLGSVSLTSSGFILQTKGLKSGSTIVVCTMAAVASMVTGVLAGLLALGEALPSSPGLQMARWGSWAAILLGVSSLAAGAAGIRTAITTCIGCLGALLPRWAWRLLPRGLALRFHRRQKAVSLLPVADSQGAQSAAFL